MSNQSLERFAPLPQPEIEILETYKTTRRFYDEVNLRDSHAQYCQWYDSVSAQHQRDLEQMRKEFNLMRWFLGWRR